MTADVRDGGDFKHQRRRRALLQEPPNFEAPTSRRDERRQSLTGTYSNTYSVVQASDGGSSNDAGEAMVFVTWFKVTVRVTDVEEKGSVSLQIAVDQTG